MSILDDPKPVFSINYGDDPNHALFFTSLKNDGSSYVLEANEKTRLIKPLKYMANEQNGEDENDLDSHAKTEGIKFRSNYDCDYKLFFKNMRLEVSNVIYQYKNCMSVVYDGLVFSNSQTYDNAILKKRMYTDAIRYETTSNGLKEDVNNHCGSPKQTMCSNFRVQIIEILCKPYDKEEHERLMQEITKRKPQQKHRDLRSRGVKFYPSDKMGKSLLDHHVVLKRKIEAVVAGNDDLKQLNLLRYFFFWLQQSQPEEVANVDDLGIRGVLYKNKRYMSQVIYGHLPMFPTTRSSKLVMQLRLQVPPCNNNAKIARLYK
ncbi:hypothetical protein M9H77_16051 [Catharanthus roseus]|uniref:Uncharacterized protein n=1 Tax=Catharanthus roseus TaxID=4058 RepID=A0ACC0B0X4_CATRO|nr:hypothetical protein M9H77_16051 [Catharanthus roseus]